MAKGDPVTLRLTIQDPIVGVAYSLQDADNALVDRKVAGGQPLFFDAPVRLFQGKFLGPFVRREGPVRRFVYLTVGGVGRIKVDVHEISADLLAAALAGAVLEITLPGRDAKGRPALATVKPVVGWRVKT